MALLLLTFLETLRLSARHRLMLFLTWNLPLACLKKHSDCSLRFACIVNSAMHEEKILERNHSSLCLRKEKMLGRKESSLCLTKKMMGVTIMTIALTNKKRKGV